MNGQMNDTGTRTHTQEWYSYGETENTIRINVNNCKNVHWDMRKRSEPEKKPAAAAVVERGEREWEAMAVIIVICNKVAAVADARAFYINKCIQYSYSDTIDATAFATKCVRAHKAHRAILLLYISFVFTIFSIYFRMFFLALFCSLETKCGFFCCLPYEMFLFLHRLFCCCWRWWC